MKDYAVPLKHNDLKSEERGSIGLAKVKLDRFIALETENCGELITNVLQGFGEKLLVNCVVEGELRIEVLDKSGETVEGMSAEDCVPITGDHLNAEVKWTSGKKITQFRDKPMRLRFIMKQGRLYSFKIK